MAPKSSYASKVVNASLCRPPTAAANDEWFKECFECGWSEQRERRLLESWVVKARRHGTAPHRVVSWVRRKVGCDVVVWRQLADGSLGVAAPCVFCQRELQRFDMRVHCRAPGGGWFSGRLDDPQARPPPPQLTSQQRKALRRDAAPGGAAVALPGPPICAPSSAASPPPASGTSSGGGSLPQPQQQQPLQQQQQQHSPQQQQHNHNHRLSRSSSASSLGSGSGGASGGGRGPRSRSPSPPSPARASPPSGGG